MPTGRNAGPHYSIHGKMVGYVHTAVFMCGAVYDVLCCCVDVYCCVDVFCTAVFCCVDVCFYWFVSLFLVIFLVFRRMRPNFLDFFKPPFS